MHKRNEKGQFEPGHSGAWKKEHRETHNLSFMPGDWKILNDSACAAGINASRNVKRLLEMESDLDAFITAKNENETDLNWAFVTKYFKKGE